MTSQQLYDKVKPTLDCVGWPSWVDVSSLPGKIYPVFFALPGIDFEISPAVSQIIIERHLMDKVWEKYAGQSCTIEPNYVNVNTRYALVLFGGDTLLDALIAALEEK